MVLGMGLEKAQSLCRSLGGAARYEGYITRLYRRDPECTIRIIIIYYYFYYCSLSWAELHRPQNSHAEVLLPSTSKCIWR